MARDASAPSATQSNRPAVRADGVEWVGDLARVGAEWDELAAAHGPFMTRAWLESWLQAFGAGCEPRICLVWRGGRIAAALPLVNRDGLLEPWANVHSPSFQPLGADSAALATLMRAALDAAGGELSLPGVPIDHPLARERLRGFRAIDSPSWFSPAVETSGPFDEWREQSRPRWGAPLERFRRKMQREHDAELRMVETPPDWRDRLEAGLNVEASGWKGREGTAVLSSAETATFYRAVAEAFATRGELSLSSIVLDGNLVAFDLCLLAGGRLHLLKTGFDENYRRFAPGLVLRLSAIERCFELGLETFELLGDRSEWKAKFQTTERPHVTWTGYALDGRGMGRYAVRRAGRVAKRLVRRARRRT